MLNKRKFDKSGIAYNTPEAIIWFLTESTRLSSKQANRSDLSDISAGSTISIGKIVLFDYDAKMKDSLPIWDSKPLSIIIGETKKTYYGINIHYLPPEIRVSVVEKIYAEQMLYGKRKFKSASWRKIIKIIGHKLANVCIKQYLKSNMDNQTVIRDDYWLYVVFLPFANFQKMSKHQQWKSVKKIIKSSIGKENA